MENLGPPGAALLAVRNLLSSGRSGGWGTSYSQNTSSLCPNIILRYGVAGENKEGQIEVFRTCEGQQAGSVVPLASTWGDCVLVRPPPILRCTHMARLDPLWTLRPSAPSMACFRVSWL